MKLATYIAVFAVLVGSTAVELFMIGLPLPRNLVTTLIMGLAGMKALLIALFFQHLKDEPRVLSVLVLLPLVAAAALITISMASVQSMGG